MSQAASSVNWTANGIQVGPSPVPKPRDDLAGGLHPAGFDLPVAQRQDLEQSHALVHPLEAVAVLRDGLASPFWVMIKSSGRSPIARRISTRSANHEIRTGVFGEPALLFGGRHETFARR